MKKLLISLTTIGALAGCYGEPVDEGDQYFDRVTPIPGQSQAANATAIPPLQPIQAQPIGAQPVAPQATTDAGVPIVDPAYDGFSQPDPFTTPAAAAPTPATTSPTPAPAKGLYEPALAAPQGEVKAKKSKTRASKVSASAKSIDLREYGASQTQLVGEKKYSRTKKKYNNGGNCHEYSVPEIAQIAFLNAGGPRKDPLLLDGDGDGFACAWVPQR